MIDAVRPSLFFLGNSPLLVSHAVNGSVVIATVISCWDCNLVDDRERHPRHEEQNADDWTCHAPSNGQQLPSSSLRDFSKVMSHSLVDA